MSPARVPAPRRVELCPRHPACRDLCLPMGAVQPLYSSAGGYFRGAQVPSGLARIIEVLEACLCMGNLALRDWDTPAIPAILWAHPRWQRGLGLHPVMALAEGHLAALKALQSGGDQLLQLNLGSGQGHSMLRVIEPFGSACGQAIPYVVTKRRSGNAAITVADSTATKRQLGGQTRRNLHDSAKTAGIGSKPIRMATPPLKPFDSPC